MTSALVSMTDRPYQLLPPLNVEQMDALRQSIQKNGVLEPVVFDEEGEILDGHHRVQIAEELGIEYPRRVIDDLDRPGKHMYALTVNVARRQLSQSDRGGLVAQMRLRGMSIRQIAEMTGVSRGTVANDLAQVSNLGHLPEKVRGADGKEYASKRSKPNPAPATKLPDLTPDVHRVLFDAGPDGRTAWQIAFLIDSANPDEERVQDALCQLSDAGKALVVGQFEQGAALWALAELVDAADTQTPGPAADQSAAQAGPGPAPESAGADAAPPADSGPTADEPEITQKPARSKPSAKPHPPADDQRDAREHLRRIVLLAWSPNWPKGHIDIWAEHLGPHDEELTDLLRRAKESVAVLTELIQKVHA